MTIHFIKFLFFFIFITYWLLTFFFNFPESSVVISENYNKYKVFQKYFYQRWEFFAPPPNSNTKLYFEYYYFNNEKKLISKKVEIFKNQVDKIKSDFLLNDLNANLEYILFSKSNEINDFLAESYKIFKTKYNLKNDLHFKDFSKNAVPIIQKAGMLNFFIDYSEKIAEKLHLPKKSFIKFSIYEKDIAPYSERYENNYYPENLIFSSNFFNFNSHQWVTIIE